MISPNHLSCIRLLNDTDSQLRAAIEALEHDREQEGKDLLASSESTAREALAIARRVSPMVQLAALNFLSGILFRQQRYAEAKQTVLERLSLAQEAGDLNAAAACLEALGRAALELGQLDEAAEFYEKATRTFETRQAALPADALQVPFAEQGAALYAFLLKAHVRRADPSAALEVAERAKGRAFLHSLGTARLRPPSSLDPELVHREEELLRGLSELGSRWRDSDPSQTGARARFLRELVEKQRELQELWSAMARDRGGAEYAELRSGHPLPAAALRPHLETGGSDPTRGVAFLEYLIAPQGSWLFVLSPRAEQPLAYELDITAAQLEDCRTRLLIDCHGIGNQATLSPAIRRALSLPPRVRSDRRVQPPLQGRLHNPALRYEFTYWEALSDALLPPAARTQLDGCELLCVSPSGALHGLPFAALRWSDAEFLGERFGLCHVPSGSVLRYCQPKNHRRADPSHVPRSCLIAAVSAADEDASDLEADGELSGDSLAAFVSSTTAGADLTLLVGPDGRAPGGPLPVTKTLLLDALRRSRDVIHLACHGVFGEDAGGEPLDSGLVLSAGGSRVSLDELAKLDRSQVVLTAREIFQLELDTDLVALRACSSGRAALLPADELMGLMRAFFYAGAPSLLLSLWNVNKNSSRQLLNAFYRRWLDPEQQLPKWRALQLAQADIMRMPEFSHPFHWAPFVLEGDWL